MVENKTTLTNKQMQLHVYCKDDLEVCIDERRMEQVMLNLLHNAYQHSPENTSITMCTHGNRFFYNKCTR